MVGVLAELCLRGLRPCSWALFVYVLCEYVLGTLGESAATSLYDPPIYPSPVKVDTHYDITTHDDEVKKDREPLLRSSKILHFLPERYFDSVGSVPGPVGLRLPTLHPASISVPEVVTSQVVTSQVVRGQRPQCAGTSNYCLYDRNYPLDKVNAIIDRYYNDIRHIYGDLYRFPTHDIIYYENVTRHYSSSSGARHHLRREGHFVCESTVEYVRPGWAQNLRGEWVAILNTDKFPQTMRVETCSYGGKRCEYLPPCYKSSCVQRYSYVRLLCVDPYHPTLKPVVDVFQIPAACSCFVEDFTYY
ncbi:neurotrophin 1 isoform X3 [Cherax quadricarinatus]|nr:neurotrophin 1-like isoform X2 [Cherax quadricarinatus]